MYKMNKISLKAMFFITLTSLSCMSYAADSGKQVDHQEALEIQTIKLTNTRHNNELLNKAFNQVLGQQKADDVVTTAIANKCFDDATKNGKASPQEFNICMIQYSKDAIVAPHQKIDMTRPTNYNIQLTDEQVKLLTKSIKTANKTNTPQINAALATMSLTGALNSLDQSLSDAFIMEASQRPSYILPKTNPNMYHLLQLGLQVQTNNLLKELIKSEAVK